jgi:hypothetical protein
MIKNLANAFEGEGSAKASRDFLTELMMQQPGLRAQLKGSTTFSPSRTERKLSESSAAKCYYIMSDMHEQCYSLLDVSSSRSGPPAAEYMSDNIELRGYLGESIMKGSNLYIRTISSVIYGVRESIRQKLILVEKPVVSRVELLPSRAIRLSQTFWFRIPPPGVSLILPESVASGPPIKLEIISDYKIDAGTGFIVEHQLVETRINGQLTPGDQVSRWIQRLLKTESIPQKSDDEGRINAFVFSALSETVSWLRSINDKNK